MSDILKEYARLSRYYRALAEARRHFEQQLQVLGELFRRHGIGCGARILDAACGTGDIVAMLYRQGYTNVEGVDGCPEMLARGRELPEHGRIKLSPCPWGEARQVLENRGSFDCIFLLGNSVAHFEKGQIKDLLALLADHLSPDGMLAFDMRNWTRAASGALVEAGRPVNVYRWLGEIRLGDRRFWVDDVCAYGEERQYISYRFRRMAVNDIGWDFEESPLIKVSYATFDMDEACAWLKAAGCDHGSIETQLPCGWSYIVVSARRSR